VLVNAVAPGLIGTDMTNQMNEGEREKLLALVSLRRMGSSDEVASLVAFLASKQARYITGQVIGGDGGLA
jgi:3-oxoacyl-[acyl-carrier protein] reductase